jgi:DNA-directed RNA polymerase subunit H (RpoH/RPB5)
MSTTESTTENKVKSVMEGSVVGEAAATNAAIRAAAGGIMEQKEGVKTLTKEQMLEMTREAYYFLRCRNNLLDILETRGFNVSTLVAESPQEIAGMFRDPSKISFSYYIELNSPNENNEDLKTEKRKCKVLFGHSVSKMLDDVVKIHTNEENPERVIPGKDEVLIITFGKLTDTDIRKTMLTSRTIGLQIDSIHVQNIQFNPLKHELVPEYEPIPFGDPIEKEIMEKLSIKKIRQLPLIRSYDIISRLLGLRPNQMVIVRNKGPAVVSNMIRVCVDG